MPKHRPSNRSGKLQPDSEPTAQTPPRIVGGELRGRKLIYSGDTRTRPMKDRVREAVFNLIGPSVKGMHAIDLFAGTGALGFEALSRGAALATFIEQHFPTSELIHRTAVDLGVAERTRLAPGNAFIWAKRDTPADGPAWLVFVSPPWAFFHERQDQMIELITDLLGQSPADSILVVEADELILFQSLPQSDLWDIREYHPAIVGILRK